MQPKKNQKQNKSIDTDNRVVVRGREGGLQEGKMGKRINCMVTNGNQIFGGKHTIVYAEVEL